MKPLSRSTKTPTAAGGLGGDTRQAITDSLVRFVAAGGFLTTALLLPNSTRVFGKPLTKLLNSLDERSRQRELNRTIYYMKRRGLITYTPYDYENGIRLTPAGRNYLKQREVNDIAIRRPERWDGHWRLIFFDIPEEMRSRRDVLDKRLRLLEFQVLQKSIWIHPFPCRRELEAVTEHLGVRKYVTYVEITHIDGESALKRRFNHLLSS